jgi:5-carboxymethyl-2-hydroxymuconate isomerase
MVDDLKNIRNQLFKAAMGAVSGISGSKDTAATLRDTVASLATLAGKGKDEIVQMISREIGQAVAGVIKEPILEIIRERKLQITIELKDAEDKPQSGSKKKSSKK